jgi:hypothetical protein
MSRAIGVPLLKSFTNVVPCAVRHPRLRPADRLPGAPQIRDFDVSVGGDKQRVGALSEKHAIAVTYLIDEGSRVFARKSRIPVTTAK